MADSGEYTPETIASKQKLADALLLQATKPREIRHWAQGLGQLGEAALGGWLGYKAEQDQKEGTAAQAGAIASLLNGGTPATSQSAPPPDAPPVAPSGEVAPPATGVSVPRGIRNNNPLNIEEGAFTQGQPGFSGSDGRFAKFDTPDSGYNAASKLLDSYERRGINTPASIVNRWAPSADGNNTSAYAAAVAKALNIGPNDPIPRELRGPLIAAMGQHENGRPIPIPNAQPGMAAQPIPNASGSPPVQLAQNGPVPPQVMAAIPPNPVSNANVAAAAANPPVQLAGGPPPPQNAPVSPAVNPAAPVDSKAAIAKMLNDPNPYVRKLGIQLGQAAVAKQLGQQPKYHKLNDEMLFEEGSGKTMPAGPGFKPLVDPAQRAQFGIPATDNRPYQLGPGNKLINPPAETRLNIDQRAETAFDTASAKHQAERFDKLVQGGMDAKGMRADVGALQDIGSRITTGKTAQITEALGPYAEALGVKIDGLGDLQAYEAIVSKLAPRMRVAGSGATSDFEMKTFLKALPGLGKTPEGNATIQSTMEALQDHHEKAADIASRAMNKELTPKEADKMLRELPDPLTAWKKSKGVSSLGAKETVAPNIDDLVKKYSK